MYNFLLCRVRYVLSTHSNQLNTIYYSIVMPRTYHTHKATAISKLNGWRSLLHQ